MFKTRTIARCTALEKGTKASRRQERLKATTALAFKVGSPEVLSELGKDKTMVISRDLEGSTTLANRTVLSDTKHRSALLKRGTEQYGGLR